MGDADFTIADVLDEARALVERGWCRISYAEDAAGNRVYEESPDAVAFCVTGAINRVCGGRGYNCWKAATDAFERAVGQWGTAWNDRPGRTQQEVVAAFREAAALVRKSEIVTPSEWTKLDAYLADIEMARS